MKLVPSDVMHGHIALTGFYELRLTRSLLRVARGGGFLVDVGANAGYFTLLWAAAHPSNEVLAIEASPRNLPLLKHNVTTNQLDDSVTIRGVAAGRELGKLAFDLGPEEQTGWGGFSSDGSAETETTVDVFPLDDLVGVGRVVDFLKVDVEGADTWVLMGAVNLLRNRAIRLIHYEQNRPRLSQLGISETQAGEFLADHGYTARELGDPGEAVVDWIAYPGDRAPAGW